MKVELIRKRPLPDYVQYIHGSGNYSIGFDFRYLRELTKEQAEKAVDFSHFKIMESIFLCILDVLQGNGGFTDQGCYKLLKEYSLLYFRMFQKVLGEFVIFYHIFKLSQTKIITFYVQTRLTLFILHETALTESTLDQRYRDTFRQIVGEINEIYKLLLVGQAQICRQKNYVGETFKVLKITYSLDKKVISFSQNARKIIETNSNNERVQ